MQVGVQRSELGLRVRIVRDQPLSLCGKRDGAAQVPGVQADGALEHERPAVEGMEAVPPRLLLAVHRDFQCRARLLPVHEPGGFQGRGELP